MADKEVVLEIGVEGGGATVYRTPLASGGWQYHIKGTSMGWEPDDDWRSWSSEPVMTVEEAIQRIAKDGTWVFFHPLAVHPAYRTAMWELAQATANKLVEGGGETWRGRHDWQDVCQRSK